MSPGRNHERISRLINILVADYCLKYEIPCFLFGSDRLKVEGKEGKEPDEAFAFNIDKEMPDLAIEVNFTSDPGEVSSLSERASRGSIQDLTKYKYLKIKEVWVYQDQEIKFYKLEGDRYEETTTSINLNKIDSQAMTSFINKGYTEDTVKIRQEFLQYF